MGRYKYILTSGAPILTVRQSKMPPRTSGDAAVAIDCGVGTTNPCPESDHLKDPKVLVKHSLEKVIVGAMEDLYIEGRNKSQVCISHPKDVRELILNL